jgi:dUTP pyrophosphatase
MIIKIKKLNPNATIPSKAKSKDFCYDCVAVSEEEIAPNIWKYGLGFAIEPMRSSSKVYGYSLLDKAISIDIRPRSSVWKTGMVLANCEGTVDEGYRGEISVIFYHVMPGMPRYKVGDRVCQIKLGSAENLSFIEVEELSETDRGDGGFGSTGK